MFDRSAEFRGVIERGGIMLFQNTGARASPQAVAQRACLWTQTVQNQQKSGDKIRVVNSARGSTNTPFRSAGELKFASHPSNRRWKIGRVRKPLEQILDSDL